MRVSKMFFGVVEVIRSGLRRHRSATTAMSWGAAPHPARGTFFRKKSPWTLQKPFLCQRRIDLHQSLCYILMYRTLTDPKLFRSLPYCRIVFNNIVGNIDCAFLDIIFQRKSPQNTFLHCMKCSKGLWLFVNSVAPKFSYLSPHKFASILIAADFPSQ